MLTDAERERRRRWERHFNEYIDRMTKQCEEYNHKQNEIKLNESNNYDNYKDSELNNNE